MILSLASSSESWVIDSGASFHTTFRRDIFQSYVKGELEKVYLGGDEPYDIVEKDDMMVSLLIGLTLKLRNIRHVLKLKKYLISVDQLANGGMKITFDGDVCKITKGAMVITHGKKKGSPTSRQFPLHDVGF